MARKNGNSDGAGSGWQQVPEVGNGLWRVAFFAFCLKFLGRRMARFFVVLVFLFAFPFLKTPKKFSAQFLSHVQAQTGKKYSVFKHLLSFAFSLLDKLAVRLGKFHFENASVRTPEACEKINRELAQKRGAFLICSHLGNAEMLRIAFPRSTIGRKAPLNVVMSVSATAHFQKNVQRFDVGSNGESGRGETLIPVDRIGAGTAMNLEEKISRGEIVVMAGDRGLGSRERPSEATTKQRNRLPFLGEEATFPQGVFRFACALGCPIYAAFLLPAKKGADAAPELSLFPLTVPAGTPPRRAAKIIRQNFVSILEKLTLENPYQWFNFFDFWQK